MDLSGLSILVTGADGGIGRALVQELAKRDVHLLAGMRDPANFARGQRARSSGGAGGANRALLARGDRGLLAELGSRRVDVLINNAGEFAGGCSRARVDEIYSLSQVNFAGLMHLTKVLLEPMLAAGRARS